MPTDRQHRIAAYGHAYDQLVAALAAFPREMWQVRTANDPWTIHEILIHIADSEANSYIRARRCIAEPGSLVMAYEENRWARELHYHEQAPEAALALFLALRTATYHLIQTLPEAVWSHAIEHPEQGTMTLDDWLQVYAQHIPEHIAQMQRIHAAWQREQAS